MEALLFAVSQDASFYHSSSFEVQTESSETFINITDSQTLVTKNSVKITSISCHVSDKYINFFCSLKAIFGMLWKKYFGECFYIFLRKQQKWEWEQRRLY